MGVYLNSKKPGLLFEKEVSAPYFVDKTEILRELVAIVSGEKQTIGNSNRYVCITRPRRFGKTVMANMIAAYFGRGSDSRTTFDGLAVSSYDWYETYRNQYHVVYISLNEVPDECTSYLQYISRIKRKLLTDLMREFPDAGIEEEDAVWDAFNNVIEFGGGGKFIFVLDEWDYVFHQDFANGEDKKAYIRFLNTLLKDQPYVELAYMTGILPISKYSSGSELNMFGEYTMITEEKYSEYFGFMEREVDELFERYQMRTKGHCNVTRDGLRLWYNGYHTRSRERVYNPRSVVFALENNNLGNYWTSSGPYDEIFYYIEKNVDDVRDDIALMVSGIPVEAKVREYAATSMALTTRNEIFSAMVVYGFLNYEDGCVSIPNKELMDKFADMIEKEPSLGYVYRLARESDRMLRATKAGDTETMAEILEYAHNTESPLLYYSNETALTMIVNMVYLSARDSYRIEREDKAGIGYVDFIFYPMKKGDDCMILELKAGRTAAKAVEQIKDRQYALKFMGKLGEESEYTGRILAVGIGYDREKKRHSCEVEVLKA